MREERYEMPRLVIKENIPGKRTVRGEKFMAQRSKALVWLLISEIL